MILIYTNNISHFYNSNSLQHEKKDINSGYWLLIFNHLESIIRQIKFVNCQYLIIITGTIKL